MVTDLPVHGVRQNGVEGWEVYSPLLQYPVMCGSPADAKRVAMALELRFPQGRPVDYSAVDAAIAAARVNHN